MPMQHLMRDTVRLIKADGQRFDGIKASVQRGKIFTADAKIPIEEGDVFERDLPSGVTEKYRVTDAGFYESIGGIPAHYQTRVEKITRLDTANERQPQQIIYNLIGENARINIESHDASTNIVNVQPEHLFDELRSAISQAVEDGSARTALIDAVNDMKESHGTEGFLQKYQRFVSVAADHMTLIAPFMPALAQMLTSAT